jgi:hypothetical protein
METGASDGKNPGASRLRSGQPRGKGSVPFLEAAAHKEQPNQSLTSIGGPLPPDSRLIFVRQARQGSNPDQRGWSSPCFRYTTDPEPPAGIEPTLRPYEGRVLAVDTTEADGDGGSRTRSSSLQARCSATIASSPGADGWSRTTTARGGGVTAR